MSVYSFDTYGGLIPSQRHAAYLMEEGGSCPACSETFSTGQELHDHQAEEQHFKCQVPRCSQSFGDPLSLCRHNYEDHPTPQDIECPGCEEHFKSASGFVSHIETRQCKVIVPEDFHRHRSDRAVFSEGLRRIEEQNSFPVPPKSQKKYDHFVRPVDEDTSLRAQRPPPESLVDSPIPCLLDFPVLGTEQDTAGITKSAKRAYHAVPPPDNFEPEPRVRVQEESDNRVKDPEQRGYNVATFYEPILEKFKCPHFGCNAKFVKSGGLTAHLKSSVHKPACQYECPCCHKTYNSMTAIMQHVEAPSAKCGIRKSSAFRPFVSQITGGALIGENIEDFTFEINEDFARELKIFRRGRNSDQVNGEGKTGTKDIGTRRKFWDAHETEW